jgi:hypothetical protein
VKGEKHCEFIAKHRRTGTEVYVEAKSRVRPGVLNEVGTFDDTKVVKAGVRQLYQSALSQAPQDKPFLIFIDVNLPTDSLPAPEEPLHAISYDNIPWMVEIETTPGQPDKAKESKIDSGFGSIKLVQKAVPQEMKEEDGTELTGIIRVTLTANWTRGGADQSKAIAFYVYRL